MKTIKEIQTDLYSRGEILNSRLNYLNNENLDFDVFLPTKNKNLQRDFVWNIEQKRELIWSMLIGRYIPNCLILDIIDPNDYKKSIWQVIDGKQRLSTMLDFLNNKFTIIIEDNEYFYKDLPNDYQLVIKNYDVKYYRICESFTQKITDDDKIKWFKFINFAGTPQDKNHLDSLSE